MLRLSTTIVQILRLTVTLGNSLMGLPETTTMSTMLLAQVWSIPLLSSSNIGPVSVMSLFQRVL